MEKIACDVIRDLLPLYCDDVASEESRALVEEHLKVCGTCAGMLKKMKTGCSVPDEEEQAQEAVVKGMASVWRRSLKKSFLKGASVAALFCLLIAGVRYALTRVILVDVPGNEIEASVERVTDAQVVLSVTVANGKRVSRSYTEVTEDGKCYVIFRQAIFAEKNGEGESWTGDYALARNRTLTSGEKISIKEIYCGDEEDGVLVWRE